MTENNIRELVVLGAGPGGYAAAFYAADLGMRVTLIDKKERPGGICLHEGCIPSKALLHAAKVMREADEASEIGILFQKPELNLEQLRTWKESVVDKLTGGLGVLCKQRNVEYIQGNAQFKNSDAIQVDTAEGLKEIQYQKCILATGSRPAELPGLNIQSDHIWDSTDALSLKEIPKSLLVIGAGYIGMELGSVYAQFGSEVTVVEMLPQIMPGMDKDLINTFIRRSKSLFKEIKLESKVISVQEVKNGLEVIIENKNGEQIQEVFSKVLVSIGRVPNSNEIGIEKTDIQLDNRGFVQIKENGQTDDPSIWAIGDIVGGALLAHKASFEGRKTVDAILNRAVSEDPKVIPGVVYTDPEIAVTGLSETEAKEKGLNVQVLKFPWAASGRAIAMNNIVGVTKFIVDPESKKILGAGIAGQNAGEMISELSLAIETGCKVHDIGHTIHPHPTLSETIMETADMFEGTATHIYRPLRK